MIATDIYYKFRQPSGLRARFLARTKELDDTPMPQGLSQKFNFGLNHVIDYKGRLWTWGNTSSSFASYTGIGYPDFAGVAGTRLGTPMPCVFKASTVRPFNADSNLTTFGYDLTKASDFVIDVQSTGSAIYCLTDKGYVFFTGQTADSSGDGISTGTKAIDYEPRAFFTHIRFGSTSSSCSLMKQLSVASDMVGTGIGVATFSAVSKNGNELWVWGRWETVRFNSGSGFGDTATPREVLAFNTAFAGRQIKKACTTNAGLVILFTDGTLWGIGNTPSGYLGTTTTQVDWVQIASNVFDFSIAGNGASTTLSNNTKTLYYISNAGVLWGLGFNGNGNLGNGSTTLSTTPVQILNNVSKVWVSGGAGAYHNVFVLTTTNTVHCWGWNLSGQLGIGNTTTQTTPQNNTVLTTLAQNSSKKGLKVVRSWIDAWTSSSFTVAVFGNGETYSFGGNSTSQLGLGQGNIGTSAFITTPTRQVSPEPLVDVHMSSVTWATQTNWEGGYAYALGVSGTVYEVGENILQQSTTTNNATDVNFAHWIPVRTLGVM